MPGAVTRIYLGDEAQAPDPLIESLMGAGNAPAYRGVAYIVFEDLPLEKFGNRIPQLSFEIFKPIDDPESAEQLIRSVNIIPSSGEFVYATEAISRYENGANSPENVNSIEARPDILVSLDQLEVVAPNLGSAALVVSWFGTDLRCGDCEIRPGVEVANKITIPKAWVVDGVARANAHIVSQLPSGDPAYGGTPADFAVVQAIQELKNRGKRVTFYPFVLMDVPAANGLPDPYSDNAGTIGQPAYPWRGRITCSPAPGFAGSPDQTGAAASQIDALFGNAQISDFAVLGETVTWIGSPTEWGFRRMILHYAHLCAAAGGVDTFLIASEMRGLTQIRSGAGTYPAVQALIDLAADCRAILGGATEISYAADWSEYFGHQPAGGSGDVYFHLDPLWADGNIDFIGIDNYMPLSDWRDGFSHADALAGWASIYDRAYLQSNIEGGEGFDWYYASPADRDAQTRTAIADASYGKPWVFRYKDIRSWWLNQHYDRPGGIESGVPTSWVPESKPIRFTEAGCPAVDKGTNQPNVFVDPKSSESFYPYYSRGARDDAIQRRYIEALIDYWNGNNPVSAIYAGPMIDMGELSIWCWDARPYPAFPNRSDVWGDYENWQLGHWLTGRLGSSGLAGLVREICLRGGLPENQINVSALSATVNGYLIQALESARGSLEPLARFYGFAALESDGTMRFIPRGGRPVASIGPDDLVARERQGEDIEFTRGQETELPLALKWRLINADEDYGGMTVEARRITVDTSRIGSENFTIAAPGADADMRCRRALMESWIGREQAVFALPPSRLALDATDIVLLEHDGRELEMRLASVADTDSRAIEATRTDAAIFGARPGPQRQPSAPAPTVYGPPEAAIMDLPIINEDVPAHRPWIAVYASPWYGRAAVYRSATLDGFALLDAVGRPARMGRLAFDFHSGPTARFDLGNQMIIDLYSGTLAAVTDLELFAGANSLAIESEAGVWEIVQFANAELINTRRYRLTRLLRGQRGTEGAMRDPAPAGARVCILDATIAPLSIGAGDVGLAYNWRVGPASFPVGDATYGAQAFTPAGIGLRPYSVGHIDQPFQEARVPGDLEIRWIRRTRASAGDSWAVAEAPLYEEIEAYEIDILDGGNIIRTLSASAPAATYSAAQQTADWGAPLGPGASLDIVIYQISTTFGRGAPKAETLFF